MVISVGAEGMEVQVSGGQNEMTDTSDIRPSIRRKNLE